MKTKIEGHLTYECYLTYPMGIQMMSSADELQHGDEICEQLWAEVKITKTIKVRDLK